MQDLNTDLGTALGNHFDGGGLIIPKKLKPSTNSVMRLGQFIVFGKCPPFYRGPVSSNTVIINS